MRSSDMELCLHALNVILRSTAFSLCFTTNLESLSHAAVSEHEFCNTRDLNLLSQIRCFFHTFPKCTARRVCLRVCVCESVNQEGLTEDF